MKKDTLLKRTKIANDIMYYIYTHIDTHIDIDDLSYDMQVSKFHMHRIFKEIFDRNIYECIKSIRLQKASNLLLTNKNSTISNIANNCGYSSQSSFIKAFKNRFGMTPSDWREGGYEKYSNYILSQSIKAMESKANFDGLKPTIVKMPSLECYYIRNKGYNVNIKQTWQKLQTWILNHNIKEYKQIALLHDNPTVTPLESCEYIACVFTQEEVKNDRLPKFQISSGVYAKFEVDGKRGDILRFIHWVFHKWLINSDYETTIKPSYAIYEKNNFLSEDNRFKLSFYLPISY